MINLNEPLAAYRLLRIAKMKAARESPRRCIRQVCWLKSGNHSALADERRRRRRLTAQQETNAKLDVLRVKPGHGIERVRIAVDVAAAEGRAIAIGGVDRAKDEITIGKLDLHVVADVIGHARVQRPGESPLRGVVVGRKSERAEAEGKARVRHAVELMAGSADAGTDERGQTPPGAEIDIGIGQGDPGRMLGLDVVEAHLRRPKALGWAEIDGPGIAADDLEIRLGAVLAGQIATHPVVPGVAYAESEKARIAY